MHSKLLQSIHSHADQSPEKIALYSTEGNTVTYGQLWHRIVNAAGYLQSSGLRKGDCVMLSAQKEVEFVYLYIGAHLAGVVNVVADAKNNREHLDYIASIVKPSLTFGVEIDGYKSIAFGDINFDDDSLNFSMQDCNEDDPADIMFTSGTTGNPKGVILSHFNIYSSASNINKFIGNTSDDIELLGLPICHSFGLGRLRCNMLTGATIVLHNGFANIKSVFNAFEKYGITGFGMVPAVWAYIKRFSGMRIGKYSSQIRYIEIGSAAMPIEDKEILCELFPDTRICMHYGLTEASRLAFMELHENKADLTTVGKSVVPKVDIKIFKENGTEAQPDEEGEVCVKGNMVIRSYYLPEDNDNAFINGYFRTGDWGCKSANGNLYLIARKKELINVGGKKVSPIEIEDALEKAGVGDSMCVSIPDPDGVLGEVPKALLVRNTFNKDIEEIQKDLAKYLESYKLPKVYEIVDSIPKTSSGKKKRTL